MYFSNKLVSFRYFIFKRLFFCLCIGKGRHVGGRWLYISFQIKSILVKIGFLRFAKTLARNVFRKILVRSMYRWTTRVREKRAKSFPIITRQTTAERYLANPIHGHDENNLNLDRLVWKK